MLESVEVGVQYTESLFSSSPSDYTTPSRIHKTMSRRDRAISSVIATILMVAIVVILTAAVSVAFFDVTENIREPAPNVADTTGEFEAGSDASEQVVRITYVAGDSVDVEEIEIIVRASGPGADLPTGVRLVDLPGDGNEPRALADENIQGLQGSDAQIYNDFIEQGGRFPFGSDYPGDRIIVVDDSNTWSAGDTIQFSVSVGGADFRDPPPNYNEDREADKLEVVIVHTPSNSIISEHTFTPQ